MPVFRDAQGQLYRISKKELEGFLIEDEAEARITGVELSPAVTDAAKQEAMGYVWPSREQRALSYQWPEEVMPHDVVPQDSVEAKQAAMGYVWPSREQRALSYQWPEEVMPYDSADPSQHAANESLASRFDVAI